jgi:hypothetical protein
MKLNHSQAAFTNQALRQQPLLMIQAPQVSAGALQLLHLTENHVPHDFVGALRANASLHTNAKGLLGVVRPGRGHQLSSAMSYA